MSKFKIQNVGIDTSNLNYSPTENNFTYVHTSISANNDFEVKEFVNIPDESILITSIDFLDKCDAAIINHLGELNRAKINLLLVDASCDFSTYGETLNTLLENNVIGEVGLKNPKSIKDIEKAKESITQIRFISLDICPLNFNYDLIDWCNKNDVSIIGFNPFGGYYSYTSIINSFSVPYLLGFIANYCTLVFLSGRDPLISEEERTYLIELIGKESDPIFDLRKNVFKLNKPLKRVVSTYLTVVGKNTIFYDSPFSIYSYSELEMTLGDKNKENIISLDEDIENKNALEVEVTNYLDSFEFPEDYSSTGDMMSIVRPNVLKLVRSTYSETDDWIVGSFKLDENAQIISILRKTAEHRLFRKPKIDVEQHNYVLYYNEIKNRFFFGIIQNTEEMA